MHFIMKKLAELVSVGSKDVHLCEFLQPVYLDLHLIFNFFPWIVLAAAHTYLQSLHLTTIDLFLSPEKSLNYGCKRPRVLGRTWVPLSSCNYSLYLFMSIFRGPWCHKFLWETCQIFLSFRTGKLRINSFKVNKDVSTSLCFHISKFYCYFPSQSPYFWWFMPVFWVWTISMYKSGMLRWMPMFYYY